MHWLLGALIAAVLALMIAIMLHNAGPDRLSILQPSGSGADLYFASSAHRLVQVRQPTSAMSTRTAW
ncbi:hypothetical protein [Sphingomonas faeni]|uniref:hypothetical protein n=1 Tax=Sphingomonas faeni TaxID=185950 RepID=UPI00335D2C18